MRAPLGPLVAAGLYLVVLLPLLVTSSGPYPHARAYLLEFRHAPARQMIADGILNTATFVPLGWLSRLLVVAGFGAGLSLAVETVQFFIPSRYSSLIDVLTNTGGAVLGAVIAVGRRRDGRA